MVVSSASRIQAAKQLFNGYNHGSDEVAISFLVTTELAHNRASLVILADDAGRTTAFEELVELATKSCVPVVTFATMREVGELVGASPQVAASLNLGESYIRTVTNTLNQAEDTEKEARER